MMKNMKNGLFIDPKDGIRVYFVNDILHREDGPAWENPKGTKVWYINGKRHREDGPAVEYSDGTKSWYINDLLHRENSPAIEHSNGDKWYFLNGKRFFSKEDYCKNLKVKKQLKGKNKMEKMIYFMWFCGFLLSASFIGFLCWFAIQILNKF